MQKGFAPAFIVFILAIVVVVSGVLVYTNYSNNRTKVANPVVTSQTPKPSPSPVDETANWKTYTDKMNRFTFKYPSEFLLKEDVGGSGYIFPTYYADLKSEGEEFRFEVGPKENVGLLEHFKSNQTEIFNGVTWTVVLASEYCDAGECGPTAPGFYFKKDNYYVGVYEFEKVESSQTLKKILSTFKIL